MTKQEVGALVQRYLDANPLGDITFAVLQNGVWRERYSWSVPVGPSRQPQTMFAYYELLAEVETQLEEKEHVNILCRLIKKRPLWRPKVSKKGGAAFAAPLCLS